MTRPRPHPTLARTLLAAALTAALATAARLPANAAATAKEAAAANAPSHWFAGTLRVLRGSVEVFATKVLRAKPLEVVTPTAVVGVRGTQYRVGFDTDANHRTHAEVLEGVVRFDAGNGGACADFRPRLSAAADASVRTSVTAPLLRPPDLSARPERFWRPVMHFAL